MYELQSKWRNTSVSDATLHGNNGGLATCTYTETKTWWSGAGRCLFSCLYNAPSIIKERYVVRQSLCKFCSGEALALKCNFNQRCCLCLCDYCQCPVAFWKPLKNLSHENLGVPRAFWQAARVCCCPCLCADAPELLWPVTELSQLQRGHWSMV